MEIARQRIHGEVKRGSNGNPQINPNSFIDMSPLKTDSQTPFDKLSTAERQAKYNESAYFKKKNEEAATFLKKHPIPEKFIKR